MVNSEMISILTPYSFKTGIKKGSNDVAGTSALLFGPKSNLLEILICAQEEMDRWVLIYGIFPCEFLEPAFVQYSYSWS